MLYDGYYPIGAADDPRAPYNQPDNKPVEFTVTVYSNLGTYAKVSTIEYDAEYERDEDGYQKNISTDNVPWKSEFLSQHYTPKELIAKLKEQTAKILADTKIDDDEKIAECNKIIRECDIWLSGDEELEVYE